MIPKEYQNRAAEVRAASWEVTFPNWKNSRVIGRPMATSPAAAGKVRKLVVLSPREIERRKSSHRPWATCSVMVGKMATPIEVANRPSGIIMMRRASLEAASSPPGRLEARYWVTKVLK